MCNKLYCMTNSFFGKFKKNNTPQVVEETPSIVDDRTIWINSLDKIAFPVLDNLKNNTLKKNMPFEGLDQSRIKFSYLEAFGRLFSGIAPWLELGNDGSAEARLRTKYINATIRGIENAVDAKAEDYMLFSEPKDSLVDSAFFAQGLLRSPNQIWFNLPVDVQAKIITELKNTRIIAPYENHWLLYTSMIEAALLEFTGECDIERLRYGILKFWDEWYIGDAIYGDGPEFKRNYFNSVFIHPMLNDILNVMRKYNIPGNEFLNKQLMRSSRLSAQLERTIAPDGSYPLVGEALTYRCGVFHTLSQAALLRILPRNISLGQVRNGLTAVLKSQFEGNQNFIDNKWLAIGINGHQFEASEQNIDIGSLYMCCEIFLPLGLPANDPFWTVPGEDWTTLKAWTGQPVEPDQSINF